MISISGGIRPAVLGAMAQACGLVGVRFCDEPGIRRFSDRDAERLFPHQRSKPLLGVLMPKRVVIVALFGSGPRKDVAAVIANAFVFYRERHCRGRSSAA